MPEKCYVYNCTTQAVSHGLCDTHRKRVKRHGTTQQTRPDDWGSREKHPAYKTWCGLMRYHKQNTDPHWHDFWLFVLAIPAKTSLHEKAYRPDKSKPWSANNFFWKETNLSDEARADRAAYMREWQRKKRAKNSYYLKNSDLKRTYGVTIDWYNEQHSKQGGLCFICDQPETAIIRGKPIALAVDHCHDTGIVRGLLCRACNNAIGALRHNPVLLRKAADYLEKASS